MSLHLRQVSKNDPLLRANMLVHYSQPRGFVGRSICYSVEWFGKNYGHIVAGSSTKHLPNRNFFAECYKVENLNQIVSNIFFHVNGPYPVRNFTTKVLKLFRLQTRVEWFVKYGDPVLMFETLVELPRTGECYRRDGWMHIGQTKGFTCKRSGGKGSDSWGGKRVWNKTDLRPKVVFVRRPGDN